MIWVRAVSTNEHVKFPPNDSSTYARAYTGTVTQRQQQKKTKRERERKELKRILLPAPDKSGSKQKRCGSAA